LCWFLGASGFAVSISAIVRILLRGSSESLDAFRLWIGKCSNGVLVPMVEKIHDGVDLTQERPPWKTIKAAMWRPFSSFLAL
jgi:hypothetical protein